MQNDINTLGYCQWFFFETKNTRKGHRVKFNLLNFVRKFFISNPLEENGLPFQSWYEGPYILCKGS